MGGHTTATSSWQMARRSHLGLSRGQVVKHQDKERIRKRTWGHTCTGCQPSQSDSSHTLGGVHEVLQAPCSVTPMALHVPQEDLLVLEFWEPGRVWDKSPGQRPCIRGGSRCGRPVNMTILCGSWFSTCPCQHPLWGQQSPRRGTAQMAGSDSHGMDVIL